METDRPADADVLDLDCGEDVDDASGFLVSEEDDNKGHHLTRLYSPWPRMSGQVTGVALWHSSHRPVHTGHTRHV